MLILYSSKQKVIHNYDGGRSQELCNVDQIDRKERRVMNLGTLDVRKFAVKYRMALCLHCFEG